MGEAIMLQVLDFLLSARGTEALHSFNHRAKVL